MTDKRLDQILNQALAPEISDVEIVVKKARRNYYMNRIVKIGVSVVACAALLIVGNATVGHFMTHTSQTNQKDVTVEDNPAYIKESVSDTFGFMYGDNEGHAGFIMEMPLSVKGDNIKNVTYSIENGFFEVVDTGKEDDMIVDAKEYKDAPSSFATIEETEEGKALTIYSIGEEKAADSEAEAETNQRTLFSYTVAYDKQTSDNTVINICGNPVLSEKDIAALNASSDPQKTADMYDKIFGDTVITCTVTFTDGTTQEQEIGIGGAVMTYEEIGEQTDQPVESPEDTSQKQAFVKLQLR